MTSAEGVVVERDGFTITRFVFDDALRARFLAVEARVYAGDAVHDAGPPSRDEALLAREAPVDATHCSFLITEAGVDVGRVTAIVPNTLDGERLSMLGFFACIDELRVVGPLLETAMEWLRAQGATRVLGPLNFSTWYGYRFVTEGFANGRFLLEPHNKPGYADHFRALGFTEAVTHASVRMGVASMPILATYHREALAQGVVFEPLEDRSEDELLPFLYEVATRAFVGKAAYTQIARPQFMALYAGMSAILTPGLSFLARDAAGAPLGFVFALPDWIEPLRTGSDVVTTIIVKTLAIVPDAPGYLGGALTHHTLESARALGYTDAIGALMEKWRPALRLTTDRGVRSSTIFKRYALFTRSLG